MPVFDQGGCDKAHRLDIKSIDDQAQTAKYKDTDLKCAELAVIDDFRNIDCFFHRIADYTTFVFLDAGPIGTDSSLSPITPRITTGHPRGFAGAG